MRRLIEKLWARVRAEEPIEQIAAVPQPRDPDGPRTIEERLLDFDEDSFEHVIRTDFVKDERGVKHRRRMRFIIHPLRLVGTPPTPDDYIAESEGRLL